MHGRRLFGRKPLRQSRDIYVEFLENAIQAVTIDVKLNLQKHNASKVFPTVLL